MLKKILKNRQGTALLVALLVMGVLISISLALSTLILRELWTTKGVLDAGKAYYAAESGIEVALYELDNNLPGWQTPDANYVPLKLDDDFKAVGEYRVNNTCNAYPCFDEGFNKDTVSDDYRIFYDVLDLNESITIPLFVVDPITKVEIPVENFMVQFYAAFDPNIHFKDSLRNAFDGKGGLTGWDIMRWKIFGIRESETNQRTESISDFTALSIVNSAGSNEDGQITNSGKPSWFGSLSCTDIKSKFKDQLYAPKIQCIDYPPKNIEEFVVDGQEASSFAGYCETTEAREYYNYGEDNKVDSEDIFSCFPIDSFIKDHDLNYLSLTNLMNPAVLDDSLSLDQKDALSKLYFRVEFFYDEEALHGDGEVYGNQVQREFADITANGYSGNSKQSINVKIQKGSFMPVFNFSLYSTYKTDDESK